MPEPDYAGGDGPGFLPLIVGTIVILAILVALQSCW